MGRVVAGIGWIVLAAVVTAAGFLAEAHREIRTIDPKLPTLAALSEALAVPEGPVRIRFINTATQRGGPGPVPMGYPAFLLEWSDGRGFLIDVGMDRAGAETFGRPFQWLFGADPIAFHGTVAAQLGDDVAKLAGIAFTHLHVDHTGGLAALCGALSRGIDVFQTPLQADVDNYTTSPGRDDIDQAGCAQGRRLSGGPIYAFPGLPGLVAVDAGGHTPGSTLFFARVGEITWVLAGDVNNFQESLTMNRQKPRLYSLLITPESTRRLEAVRRWLGELAEGANYRVLVSHDADYIAGSAIPAYDSARR